MNSLWDIRIFLGPVPKESPCSLQHHTVFTSGSTCDHKTFLQYHRTRRSRLEPMIHRILNTPTDRYNHVFVTRVKVDVAQNLKSFGTDSTLLSQRKFTLKSGSYQMTSQFWPPSPRTLKTHHSTTETTKSEFYPCLPHDGMYWGVDIYLHSFLTSKIPGRRGQHEAPAASPAGKDPKYKLIWGCVGPRDGLDFLKEGKNTLSVAGIEPTGHPALSLVAILFPEERILPVLSSPSLFE